ncbi:MAG: type VI secretion system baseplate subunit TssK [Proteobacteria bacterium]|nr:type VI secretion system baseplate subunit TssK [Pseudomonadota bacterium]
MEKPLFWHQGLFLQPQHLQLKDLYDQSLFTPYHSYLKPHLMGVASMDIRESSLNSFSFQVDRGAFWFPDMSYAVLLKNAIIESRHFKKDWLEGGKPLTMYLGLKKFNPMGENVCEIDPGENLAPIHTRFVASRNPEEMNDLHRGGSPAQVKHLNYLIKIFTHDEIHQLGNYDLIPVAKIERSGEEIRLARDYVPPCVSLSSSPVLSGIAKEIGDKLSFRGHELETHKKKRGIHNAEFGSRDMVYLLALRSFNRYIPYFHQLHEGQPVHPFDLYTLIKQLVGELSSFSEKISVLGQDDDGTLRLPAYNHQDLWTCFYRASVLISSLLDEITAGPEYVLPLPYDDSRFSCLLKSEYMEGDNHYYLVIRTEEDVKQVLDAVDIGVKICSLKVLPMHIERALPGAVIEYLPVPPQALPRHRNAKYFRIDNHGEQWAQIEKDKSLAIHWDNPPEDLHMELMIVRRK